MPCVWAAPLTGGATIPLALGGWGLGMAGVGTAAIGSFAPSDSGVTPGDLADHINSFLSRQGSKIRARHRGYDDFWACAKAIKTDMACGDPVIAFWTYSATAAHYVNVVGVSVDSRDLPEDFVIMNTNNWLERYNYKDMRDLMKREFAFWACVAGTEDYHIIRFFPN